MQCVQELFEAYPYWIQDKDRGSKVVAEIIAKYTRQQITRLETERNELRQQLAASNDSASRSQDGLRQIEDIVGRYISNPGLEFNVVEMVLKLAEVYERTAEKLAAATQENEELNGKLTAAILGSKIEVERLTQEAEQAKRERDEAQKSIKELYEQAHATIEFSDSNEFSMDMEVSAALGILDNRYKETLAQLTNTQQERDEWRMLSNFAADDLKAQLTEAQSQLKEKQNLTITGLLTRLAEAESREKEAFKRAESVARHHAKCHKERGQFSGFDATRLICDYEAEVCNEVANGIAALANATPSGAEAPHPLSKLNDLLWKMSGLKLPGEDKNEPNKSVS